MSRSLQFTGRKVSMSSIKNTSLNYMLNKTQCVRAEANSKWCGRSSINAFECIHSLLHSPKPHGAGCNTQS